MKTVILAGGLGTRLLEKTQDRPKPMVEIGGKPILWHIMNIYSAYGIDEFVIALGYLGHIVKDYFLNFFSLNNDVSIDLSNGKVTIHKGAQPKWKVHLVDTGLNTQTGGRLKKLTKWIGNETFMMTYGDGLADIDLHALLKFHKSHNKLATVTAVHPPARFGNLVFDGDRVQQFSEKPQTGEGWINGGFFVLEPEVLNYIEGDETAWELKPLESLAKAGELYSYKHRGYWQPMDTLREQKQLENLWQSGSAPWAIQPVEQKLSLLLKQFHAAVLER